MAGENFDYKYFSMNMWLNKMTMLLQCVGK